MEGTAFTYWNDSGFYQFQSIKEQIEETTSDDLKTQQEKKLDQVTSVKESEPAKNWIYEIIVVVLIAMGLMYYRKTRR